MSPRRFPDVPTGYPFPNLEKKILETWAEGEIFEKSMAQPAPRGEFVLYEGPPTANNVPHVGHVPSRVTKDLFPRFRTMQGYHVARKAGWDTHGLPVEIEVEKRLGFSGKEEIERYGIAEFNRACLESVRTYEREWRAMTERLGYWTDLDHAYFTFTNKYIESVWWALSQLHEQGLLSKGYKIQPYCARCGTTLSSHEVAQNYKETDDPSIWVLFPVRPGQTLHPVEGGSWTTTGDLRLVAWTTTPWTVLAHVGLAVHPDLIYRVVGDPRDPERFLLFGDDLAQPVPLDVEEDGQRKRLDLRDLEPIVRVRGSALEGLRYDRPYQVSLEEWRRELEARGESYDGPDDESGFLVVTGDYVTAEEGTGLVHTAPRFGEDDYKTGLTYGLPMLRTIDDEGQVTGLPGLEPFTGTDFKAADPAIIRDLKGRGFLLHTERYRHNYPFCWRCDRPLLYFATESWFVNTTRKKERLIELNRTIGWHPEHVGEGRFGNWLENMVDWALSRRRYWGTPLPVWECDCCGETVVPGSYERLFELAGRKLPDDPYDPEQFNPHRPSIDEMTWICEGCADAGSGAGGTFRRVEEVIDAWFDSGSMPYAQHHYPFENRDLFEQQFPADLIAEGVDQTRGWFYTLHALGGLLFDSVAYKNCIVLGHINDEDGRKMSKRLGNVLEPMAVIAKTGADALRWYLCISNPELTSRFGERLVRESAQNYLIPLWNALSFFTIYANLDGWRPGTAEPIRFAERPALDRWILLRLDRVIEGVTGHLEGYRIVDAARVLEAFVDDLTNWYIRRSRGRFWADQAGAPEETETGARAKESAYQTLYEVLTTVARLTAPFTPFVAEELHERLERSQDEGRDGSSAESVHLERWPEPSAERDEPDLERAMAAAQRIVRLGHAARNTHGLKTRQPLASVTLVAAEADLPELLAPYQDLVADELNVQRIEWAAERADYVSHEVKPHYPKTGPRFGKRMKEVAAALRAADGDRLAEALEADGKVTIEVGGEAVELSAEELEVRLDEREGIAAQGDRELLVALDTELTPALVAEGLAREVVNRIQTARKDADLDYADRIRVRYRADDALEAAIDIHRDWIAGETLAVEITPADGEDAGLTAAPVDEHALAFAITTVA